MTEDEIRDLKAGGALNALVATMVMGWVKIERAQWQGSSRIDWYPPFTGMSYPAQMYPPDFSRNGEEALSVIHAINKRGWEVKIIFSQTGSCSVEYRSNAGEYIKAWGDTMEHAACKAALLLVNRYPDIMPPLKMAATLREKLESISPNIVWGDELDDIIDVIARGIANKLFKGE